MRNDGGHIIQVKLSNNASINLVLLDVTREYDRITFTCNQSLKIIRFYVYNTNYDNPFYRLLLLPIYDKLFELNFALPIRVSFVRMIICSFQISLKYHMSNSNAIKVCISEGYKKRYFQF